MALGILDCQTSCVDRVNTLVSTGQREVRWPEASVYESMPIYESRVWTSGIQDLRRLQANVRKRSFSHCLLTVTIAQFTEVLRTYLVCVWCKLCLQFFDTASTVRACVAGYLAAAFSS